MVKSVDGGGGRGIRLVRHEGELRGAVESCIRESPPGGEGRVFVEKAAMDGFQHVEVQIIGDGSGEGGVRHLWERDCSVQRRYQKIVEVAPCAVSDRSIIVEVIQAAVKMAEEINYLGLATWEFVANVQKGLFYFLEANPRLQVEHTITEGISGTDLVQTQLLLAQGASLEDVGLGQMFDPWEPPPGHSIQVRLCAEDSSTFTPSIGKITSFHLPSGNGIRVDTHLAGPSLGVIGSDFDNLVAKIIVTASTRSLLLRKARRALEDAQVAGVKTNLNLLRAIVTDQSFEDGAVDTSWLEKNVSRLVANGHQISTAVNEGKQTLLATTSEVNCSPSFPSSSTGLTSSTSTLLRKGDAWSIGLQALNLPAGEQHPEQKHHIHLSRILRNEFPTSLSAEFSHTTTTTTLSNLQPPNSTPSTTKTTPYTITLSSTTTSPSALSSPHRHGDRNSRCHITTPLSGKLLEVLVQPGDEIREGEVVAFIRQMKMELEIRSPRKGMVRWVVEMDEGVEMDVVEGVLLVEFDRDTEVASGRIKEKL